MELIHKIEDFHPLNDTRLLEKAAKLAPTLKHTIVEPVGAFRLKERYGEEREEIDLRQLSGIAVGKGENLCLDFGDHQVGYLTLDLSCSGSHPDAPAFLKLKFAETPGELSKNSEDYDGWISRSWIQEEYIHVDVLPAQVTLPRRFAFRYLKITVMDTSPKYKLVVRRAECRTETAADWSAVTPLASGDPVLDRLDAVSLRTLANCMQDVFEDGPKRDQRLWVGDLRLQALTNAVSFRNFDLVKRCLYLFAGSRFPDGRVSACLFTKPAVEGDDTYLFDYSLLYVAALEEYLQQTDDVEALDDLYDIAVQQIEISLGMCENDVVAREAVGNTFIDWCMDLDKAACAQAVLIYALQYARRLACRKNDLSKAEFFMEQAERLKKAALARFWDDGRKCFVSNGQVSLASQVWMVLADVPAPEEAKELMLRSAEFMGQYRMATPYMHHYYVAALLRAGLREQAMAYMKRYWGSMLDAGADTFWEAWDPGEPDASPYGSSIINSYCHAWSCTPAFLLRTHFMGDFNSNLG